MNFSDRPDKKRSSSDESSDAAKKRKPRIPKAGWQPPPFEEGGKDRKRTGFGDRREGGVGKKSFGAKRPFRRDGESSGEGRSFGDRREGGFDKKPFGAKRPFRRDGESSGEGRSFGDRREGGFDKKPFGAKRPFRRDGESSGEGRSFGDRREGGFDKKPFGAKRPFRRDGESSGEGRSFGDRREGGFDKKPFGAKRPFRRDGESSGEGRSFGDRREGGFDKKPFGGKRPFRRDGESSGEGRSFGDRREGGFDKKPFGGKRPFSSRPVSKPWEPRSFDRTTVPAKNSKLAFRGFGSKKRKEDEEEKQYDGIVRLNKYISHSGICGRREADDLIVAGKIKVNGKVVDELGTKVNVTDNVEVDGVTIQFEPFVYVVMHKPKNTITTTSDEKGRKTVMDLVEGEIGQRLYPVGRLDRNTTGVLLLTNDGDLANRLTHPSYSIGKTYQAEIDRVLSDDDLEKLQSGVELEDGPARAYNVVRGTQDPYSIQLMVHEGRNHLVKRMVEALGAEVTILKRSQFAGLSLGDLRPGRWRFLKPLEVNTLRTKVKLPELNITKSK